MKNNLINEIKINNNFELEKKQNNFLESTLGKTINIGLDIGLRTILPDYIEEQIIDLKDNLLNYGLKDGIKKSIKDSINLGKGAIGIVTGKFDNIYQAQQAIKSGGLIDNISSLLNDTIDFLYSKNLLNYNTSRTIKQGKNIILNNIERNIEDKFNDQVNTLTYTQKYIDNWNNYYNNRDFEGMEREYQKIEKQLNNLLPLEKTINEVRKIENLHNLIKNNGKDFNLSEQEIELAKKL